MTDSPVTLVLPTTAEVDTAVYQAYADEGYVDDHGAIDNTKLREHIFEVLRPRKVLKKSERAEKAIPRGELTRAVFPSLPAPDVFEGEYEGNPVLARAVWDRIYQAVWSQVRPSASGALQRLIGYAMGNGYVLCRTTVGDDKLAAAYVTDDYECIQLDYITPDMTAFDKLAQRILANREMLIQRQPENAKRYARSFGTAMKAISAAGNDRLRLAIEASGPGSAEDDDAADPEDPED